MKNRSLVFTLIALVSILFLIGIVLYAIVYFQNSAVPVMEPRGMIAHEEKDLMIDSMVLMLLVVVPVFVFLFYFAWKYRETNARAKYDPDLGGYTPLEIVWWGIPLFIIAILSVITWKETHALDPFKPLNSATSPLKIQAIALDWKWLFLYPEQKIATVGYLQFPEKTPLNFEITADAPMNSLWIPQLGGQMYAMPGMKAQLHLISDAVGSYYGASANLSGKGFAGMNFEAKASTRDDFERFVEEVKKSGKTLNLEEYKKLAKPSQYNKPAYYRLEKEDLLDWIVMKYMMPGMNQ